MCTVLVVARKYNDIIYAVSTPQFMSATHKKLLIISSDGLDGYPLTDKFDSIIHLNIEYQSVKSQLIFLKKLHRLSKSLRSDIVFFSNVIILSSYYIAKISKCKEIILVEDGYMNYRKDRWDHNWKKEFFLKLLGVNKNSIISTISKTYLLDPARATYYYGDKCKLTIRKDLINSAIPIDFKDKKIFIGQPLYESKEITLQKYVELVNKIIKQYNIDYYLPHFRSSSEENIECAKIDLSKIGLTFEALAPICTFHLYSFSSSLLYTTKLINPVVSSTMILAPECPPVTDKDIFIENGVKINNFYI